jgi:hypothetical protein
MTPVASSNIAAVGYDPAIGEMHILFHSGRLYAYRVSFGTYQGLMNARSKGRYFAMYIRWRYRGRLIG